MTTSAPAAIALAMSPENLMPPSAMTGTPRFLASLRGPDDGGHLGDPDACHDPRRADRAWPHPHLHRVAPCVDECAAPSSVAMFPPMSWS